MNRIRWWLFLLFLLPTQASPKVIRGPYLQLATPNSMVIRWRTDQLCPGMVRFGLTPATATNRTSHSGELSEHVVRLSGLKPDTRYFYEVGRATNLWFTSFGVTNSFVTPPPIGPAQSTRVWVLGDSGTANRHQAAVRDAYYAWSFDRRTDLWLMLGDNAYSTGTDKQYQKAVFDMYPTMLRTSPLWPTLGNHDAGSANSPTQSGVYYDIFTLPTLGQAGGLPSGTEAYYSFDYANIHFICLDSHDTDRSPNGAMAQWLKADLESTARDWIICFFHHPPYTKGSHDSDSLTDSSGRLVQMRENIVPILEAGGVDLVLAGHSHDYERSYLISGAYGFSTNMIAANFVDHGDGRQNGTGAYQKPAGNEPHAGAVYIVAGSSGQTSGGPLNHRAMFLSLNKLGSLVLDVNGLELDATFLTDRGSIRDYFTLKKR
ncbi:MAG TPA: metallophosphoesterase family protein [Verrucomicrobiota bacterium]|nr:metallophosphoesterase [Verrucomicrobiales bacterium]HRI13837.1 metallophosphoesterase family protein [Verrucomicrobiota bacterium]